MLVWVLERHNKAVQNRGSHFPSWTQKQRYQFEEEKYEAEQESRPQIKWPQKDKKELLVLILQEIQQNDLSLGPKRNPCTFHQCPHFKLVWGWGGGEVCALQLKYSSQQLWFSSLATSLYFPSISIAHTLIRPITSPQHSSCVQPMFF